MAEPTLVLLHGMGTGPEAWEPQIEAFQRSRQVLAPGLQLDSTFTIEAEASRLWKLVGEGRRFDVIDASEAFNKALRAFVDGGPPDPEAGRPSVTG
ncbi:MAG TPA: hypothetical protein VKB73_13275 [Gaiellaceae bacterium]|nr:hypothetical protein [Gaiellaceae bacterium]